jgi:hypothetical protein
MSAPTIISTYPAAGQVDVVLGTPITIVFDQAMDPKTITESTFSLMGPGQTGIISPGDLLKNDPSSSTGREYITGVFTFPDSATVVFDPKVPLRPNVKYTLLVVGASSTLIKDAVKNPAGSPMAKSLQITFTTGSLAGNAAPPQSPLSFDNPLVAAWMKPVLQPSDIVVHPRKQVGNDLTQVVELIFPDALDSDTFSLDDITVEVDPLVDDPLVTAPSGLTMTKAVDGNKISITITGWA